MIGLHIVGIVALVAIVVYVVCFLCRYRVIPQSLSVTAEWSGRYRWWQVTICSVMGWLSYYFPTVYTFEDYGYYALLSSAGVAGLSLAGYYSYYPGEEEKRELIIHKVGSFSGAVCLSLFYVLGLGEWSILVVLGIGLLLGLLIKGRRIGFPRSHSIIFWEEIMIIGFVGYSIIENFVKAL